MKVESFTADRGRVVLAHMAMSTPVLSRVASHWHEKDGLFASPWENLVAGWCLDFYRQHGKAPRKGLRALYAVWAESSRDRESPKLIERFLAHVADDWDANDRLSADHVMDIAGNHFSRVRAERLREQIDAALEANRVGDVPKLVQAYRPVELGGGSYVDVFRDREALKQAFTEESYEQLITFGNPLDRFFAHMLHRQSFVALQASEKTGKSFWLGELAYLALTQRRKVAFFAIGDLTQKEMLLRFASRAAQKPTRADVWPFPLSLPISIKPPAKGDDEYKPRVEYQTREIAGPLSYEDADAAFTLLTEKKVKSRRSLFRMVCHPADSVSVPDIVRTVESWHAEGFAPDVVLIDYADILAPPPGYWQDERASTNASWKKLKAMAQSLHCLVLTATQADAGSYDRRSQTRKNFSSDKRKYAHTDGICAINATEGDREMGVVRLAWLTNRHNHYSARRECYVAGNLAVASPAIVAAF